MSSRPLPLGFAILLAFAGMGGVSAWAADSASAPDRGSLRRARSGNDNTNSLPASVRRIEDETGGRVLRAQPIERDGREVYRVKIETPQGRVRVVEDDRSEPQPQPPPDSGHR